MLTWTCVYMWCDYSWIADYRNEYDIIGRKCGEYSRDCREDKEDG